jgi:hypothetical protein
LRGLAYRGDNDQTLYLESAFPDATANALRERGNTMQLGIEPGDQADP